MIDDIEMDAVTKQATYEELQDYYIQLQEKYHKLLDFVVDLSEVTDVVGNYTQSANKARYVLKEIREL